MNNVYGKLSALRHDLRNHFIAISGFLTSQEYDEAARYVDGISGLALDQYEYAVHPVLNALLNTRHQLAKDSGVDFDADIISLPDGLPLTDVDLCVLFGNMLDNAFEATDRQEGAAHIRLTSRTNNGHWVVSCRNSTVEKKRFTAAGHLNSTKPGNAINGIGTRQIQRIAERYNGFVTYRHEGYEFAILITIPLV